MNDTKRIALLVGLVLWAIFALSVSVRAEELTSPKCGDEVALNIPVQKKMGTSHRVTGSEGGFGGPSGTAAGGGTITYDNTSNSGWKVSQTVFSWAHNNIAGDLLVVGISSESATDRTVTGITYNGQAMTSIRSDGAYQNKRTTLYYKLAPSTGSNTVEVTMSGSADYAIGCATSFIGAKQSAQPDAQNGATGTGDSPSTPTTTVTTVATNSWVVSVLMVGGENALSSVPTSSNTVRHSSTCAAIDDYVGGGLDDTNAGISPAGGEAMSWTATTYGGATYWVISAASFSPD